MSLGGLRSISSGRVLVNATHILFRSAMQKFVALSGTGADIAARVMVAQDMLYIYCLSELFELKIDQD